MNKNAGKGEERKSIKEGVGKNEDATQVLSTGEATAVDGAKLAGGPQGAPAAAPEAGGKPIDLTAQANQAASAAPPAGPVPPAAPAAAANPEPKKSRWIERIAIGAGGLVLGAALMMGGVAIASVAGGNGWDNWDDRPGMGQGMNNQGGPGMGQQGRGMNGPGQGQGQGQGFGPGQGQGPCQGFGPGQGQGPGQGPGQGQGQGFGPGQGQGQGQNCPCVTGNQQAPQTTPQATPTPQKTS